MLGGGLPSRRQPYSIGWHHTCRQSQPSLPRMSRRRDVSEVQMPTSPWKICLPPAARRPLCALPPRLCALAVGSPRFLDLLAVGKAQNRSSKHLSPMVATATAASATRVVSSAGCTGKTHVASALHGGWKGGGRRGSGGNGGGGTSVRSKRKSHKDGADPKKQDWCASCKVDIRFGWEAEGDLPALSLASLPAYLALFVHWYVRARLNDHESALHRLCHVDARLHHRIMSRRAMPRTSHATVPGRGGEKQER